MQPNWLVPFQGRNRSGTYNQNFLWRSENVYLMDNHRAALWCWLQHIEPEGPISILHIDKHTDTLCSRIEEWVQALPSNWTSFSIDDYLEFKYLSRDLSNDPFLLFRWDNYLSLFLELYRKRIQGCRFATQEIGDPPNHAGATKLDIDDLPTELERLFSGTSDSWIINLDLDFFFYESSIGKPKRRFSREFARQVFEQIQVMRSQNRIIALTVALSPECCGGWDEAEMVLGEFLACVEIQFILPRRA